ncbi:hypothetical protein A4R35_01580 [Thermogemmatispora tikiterensis]|uniref:Uncharacterized protein n=1 Tax=Thermogemmatispora tikiterensis TaxID=1825093 RepID=A0A328VIU4_9CHLR|nr:hypothetical protein A4R35_01580 [Thermogemmatispora tikiterensis]
MLTITSSQRFEKLKSIQYLFNTLWPLFWLRGNHALQQIAHLAGEGQTIDLNHIGIWIKMHMWIIFGKK